MSNTIFVQIASYKDPQLIPTLNEIISKSSHPENLRIVVCWQHGEEQTIESFIADEFKVVDTDKIILERGEHFNTYIINKNSARIELMDVHCDKSKGACWARNAIQQQYNNEKYTLQLDSHHRFIENFDNVLVDMLESLKEMSKKPLITAYIPSFDPENDPAGRVHIPWKMNFDRFIPEGAVFFIPASIDDWESLNGKPMRARFYSAHFAFADGIFVTEVPHDPDYFFHGEEISIAVRAYTHGYDLYHPTSVIAWHEYTRNGRTKIWDDHTTTHKNTGSIDLDWVERNNICHSRNRTLFGMDGLDPTSIEFGRYGFGTERTLLEYEQYAGISFKYRGVQQETLDNREPPNTIKYVNEDQWKASFVRSNDIRICFDKSDLGIIENDYDFWYVGCHDVNGNEIFRKDAIESDIATYLQNQILDFRLIFLSNIKPVTYTVWTHSKSKGWLVKVDKPVIEH